MESMNNNNNQLFLCELKELRNELSAVKKRIDHLEESHEKQQERINILERENHALKKKTELNNLDGNEEVESVLRRERTEKDQDNDEEIESKSTSDSSSKKSKTKTNNNNNDDDEAVVVSRYDNGDSFDSLSDDLLHKIVEFDGNCYSKFGLINKRCNNIYDMEEYKLKKETCLYGYGTVDMMLEHYLQQRREGELCLAVRFCTARALIRYNRLDAIDWIVQLGDSELLQWVCCNAAFFGRIDILTRVFCKCNLTMLDKILEVFSLCYNAAYGGKLKTLKWLRKYGAEWDADTFIIARDNGHDEIVKYLRNEGCPEQDEDGDESSGSEQFGSDEDPFADSESDEDDGDDY